MAAGEKTRVLIVDDDEGFTAVTAALLEKEGYQIQTAQTGLEAVGKVSHYRPEIILLDFVLPGMKGPEILDRIRQVDRTAAVITVTGHGDESRAVNAMKAGSYDYLSKPFKKQELVNRIEKAIRWREVQIIEGMSEGYLAIEKGRVAYANRVFRDILGYSSEEIIGMELAKLFPEETLPVFQKTESGREAMFRNCEVEAFHRDDTKLLLEARIGTEKFHGKLTFVGFFRDITAHRQLEEALKETQTLYENLIQNASDAIMLINPQGTFSLVNPRFCNLTAYSFDETKSLHISRLVFPDDLLLVEDRHQRILAGEDVPSNYQFRIVRKTGEVLFLDFNMNAIKRNGKIIGIQAVARDITERKLAEKELQERMEELEKWHKLTIDRELRMIELKKKIEELESQLAHIKKLKGIR